MDPVASRYRDIQSFILCMALVTLLTSCMLGPNFHSPAAPDTQKYNATPTLKKTVSTPAAKEAGKSQHFELGADIPGAWWALFHSQALNELIVAGMRNSPTLAAAKATLVQAQQNYNSQLGSTMLPSISENFTPTRQRFNSAGFGDVVPPSIFNTFNSTVSAAYTLDVFGGLRRQLEAYHAQVDYEQFELEAAYLTLTSNIVTTAVTMASLREQIKATHELIKSQQETLAIVQQQFNFGGASRANVLQQQAALAQTQATLPPLEQNLVQNQHTLSILIGELPSTDRLPTFELDKLHLPLAIPVTLPSLLVRHRPDIRASEASLHVASAQIGVATANLFPSVALSASYGWDGNILSHLIQPKNLLWTEAASFTQPIFNGGALIAQKRAAVAAYEAAAAQYRQTVLAAFKNVADILRALEHDAQTLRVTKEAETASKGAFTLVKKQYRLGGVSYLELLTAENTYQQARISRIQAQAARYSDTAALFQALGGGWWNRACLDTNADLCKNLSQYVPGTTNCIRKGKREF